MTRVTSGAGESKLNKYTLLGAFRDFVFLVKNFVLFDYSNGKYHKNQVVQVLPYQLEHEPGLQTSNSGDESDSEEGSAESSDEEIEHVFEAKNAWRLESLSWCQCGHCTLKPKAIESFCCYEKALEYDEYDALLKVEAEAEGGKCDNTMNTYRF